MKEARLEVYQLIDKHYKLMPKKADGSIDEYARGLANNDIDALRHSFVSGVYTMEYGETTADMLGRLNEIRHFNFDEKSIRRVPKDFVIKIKETKTGANVEFLDIHKKVIMTKEEFILAIKNDDYPNYSIKRVNEI